MNRLLLCFALLAPIPCMALSLSDYRALRDASTRGDVMANRLLESYLSGVAEGALVAHAISPLPGVCIGRETRLRPADVVALASIGEKLPTFKNADPARLPFAPVFLHGLKEKYPCP